MTLAADLGPAERYRRYLKLSRGQVKVAAGTRAAAFAPIADLGLVAVFDDGDDLLAEPRAPYPHTREVLMLRSAAQGCALLVGGFARTAEAELLLTSGWARPIVADRNTVRANAPRIEAAGDEYATGADSAAAGARLSPAAFAAARAALAANRPVLVQVPRRGLPARHCPVHDVGVRPVAGTATGHWRWEVPVGYPRAGGAVSPRRISTARPAGRTSSGRRWSAPGALQRNSGGRSREFS